MTNDEAKFILGGYRPGGKDATDATFAEALEQARRDPELAGWLERSLAFDRAFSARLKTLQPPQGLREGILTGGRLSRKSPVRRLPAWFALAACLAVLLGVGVLWRQSAAPEDPADFARYAISDVHVPGHKGDPDAVMQSWIESNHAPLDKAAIPSDWNRLVASGCRTLSFHDREVVELCFKWDGNWFHLYLLPNRPSESAFAPMEIGTSNGAAGVWSDGHMTYAVATEAALGELHRLL